MLNRAESDDHCGVGEAGLRDTEAVHQNFFVSLCADADERMPQAIALSAEATHQIGFGVSLGVRCGLSKRIETQCVRVEKTSEFESE